MVGLPIGLWVGQPAREEQTGGGGDNDDQESGGSDEDERGGGGNKESEDANNRRNRSSTRKRRPSAKNIVAVSPKKGICLDNLYLYLDNIQTPAVAPPPPRGALRPSILSSQSLQEGM